MVHLIRPINRTPDIGSFEYPCGRMGTDIGGVQYGWEGLVEVLFFTRCGALAAECVEGFVGVGVVALGLVLGLFDFYHRTF